MELDISNFLYLIKLFSISNKLSFELHCLSVLFCLSFWLLQSKPSFKFIFKIVTSLTHIISLTRYIIPLNRWHFVVYCINRAIIAHLMYKGKANCLIWRWTKWVNSIMAAIMIPQPEIPSTTPHGSFWSRDGGLYTSLQ